MTRSRIKVGYFALEAINSFAATYYLYYLFFLARDEFGFRDRGNLFLTAIHGFIYIFASWQGGRFAQRFGYFNALRLGYGGMAVGLALGWTIPGIIGQIIGLAAWTIPLCLIWPTLEALVTEGEDFKGTARKVGIYNVVWSSAAAVAFCIGGWLWETLGKNGFYLVPILLMVLQFLFVLWLQRKAAQLPPATTPHGKHEPEKRAWEQPVPPRRFLQMAWLASPFAYVAINTVGAVIPHLAHRFELTAAQSGVFNSLWFYVRFAAFILLWKWTGWHYRFRWLISSMIGLVLSFAVMLLARQLWIVIAAQVVFGFSIGLIYYSSLFYSMDAGDEKGAHGGLHEAAIGLGIFAGPALGAATLTFLPQYPNSGTLAVTGLLVIGLMGLILLRLKKAH
ncbi:MAG TPA: MFS transporter [Verrucomicrobiae bacterium]|nr:MFS transporter [Verrucomicrobiae bacterium]